MAEKCLPKLPKWTTTNPQKRQSRDRNQGVKGRSRGMLPHEMTPERHPFRYCRCSDMDRPTLSNSRIQAVNRATEGGREASNDPGKAVCSGPGK